MAALLLAARLWLHCNRQIDHGCTAIGRSIMAALLKAYQLWLHYYRQIDYGCIVVGRYYDYRYLVLIQILISGT